MAGSLHQRRTHPELVEGCYACRLGTIGVDTKILSKTTTSNVEGSIVVGTGNPSGEAVTKTDVLKNDVTEHRDGRVDVKIRAPHLRMSLSTKEER